MCCDSPGRKESDMTELLILMLFLSGAIGLTLCIYSTYFIFNTYLTLSISIQKDPLILHLNDATPLVKQANKSNFVSDSSMAIFVSFFLCHPILGSVQFSSAAQSLIRERPHESQHSRPPCPSPTPGVHPDSRPSSQ